MNETLEKLKKWADGLSEDAQESWGTVKTYLGDKINSVDLNKDGQPDVNKIKELIKEAPQNIKDAWKYVEEKGPAGAEKAKEIGGGIVDDIGDFFSNNKGGLLGALGAVLIGSFMGAGPLALLLLAAVAFIGGSFLGDKNTGILSNWLGDKKPEVTPPAVGKIKMLGDDGKPLHKDAKDMPLEASYLVSTPDGTNLGTVEGKISANKETFLVSKMESLDPARKFSVTFSEDGKTATITNFNSDGTALPAESFALKNDIRTLKIVDGAVDPSSLGALQSALGEQLPPQAVKKQAAIKAIKNPTEAPDFSPTSPIPGAKFGDLLANFKEGNFNFPWGQADESDKRPNPISGSQVTNNKVAKR